MNQYDFRILVVDDDLLNRRVLALSLGNKGFKVSVADSGIQALELINKKAPDLVLLDIFMPGMDGFQVLAQLKSNSDLMHIPVIVISASGAVEDMVKSIEMGAEDYITKPIDPAFLHAKITARLNNDKNRL